MHVGHLASYCSRFDAGHQWTQFIIENTDESDYSHPRALTMKGLLYLEQRNYTAAREYLVRAIENAVRNRFNWFRLAATLNFAWLQWAEMEYEGAFASIQSIFEDAKDLEKTRRDYAFAATHWCIAYVYAVMQRWPEAISHARKSQEMADKYPLYGQTASAPLGLALFAEGKQREGLRELMRGLNFTAREGMPRLNQIALDFAGIALAMASKREQAYCLFDANAEQRFAISHFRSPAERSIVMLAAGIDPERLRLEQNPLRGQSAATLSVWTCEELERTLEGAA